MVVTAAITKTADRVSRMARNLSVLSFWIAATMVFVFAVELIFPGPFGRSARFYSCILMLLVLIPVHLIRGSKSIGVALWMTAALWSSTGFLVFRLVY